MVEVIKKGAYLTDGKIVWAEDRPGGENPDLAREKGCLISYDPNLRPPLWPSLDRAREAMLSVMDRADVLKVSQEEAEFLTGLADPDAAADRLLGGYPLRLIFITLGAEGCR